MKLNLQRSVLAFSSLLLIGCGSSTSDVQDTTPPVLQTDFENNVSLVSHSSTWEINGNVIDDTSVKSLVLELNDQRNNIELNNSNFSIPVTLKAGENNFTLVAQDENDNNTTIHGSVYFGHTTAAGGSHSGAIHNGELYTWGRNNYGQSALGYTSKIDDNSSGIHPVTPTKITIPSSNKLVSLSFNQNYSIALDESGALWSWGYNKNGELGRGESTDICSDSATEPDCILNAGTISELSNIIAVSAGYSHTLALKNDGTIWAFGSNNDGELGQGDTNATTSPSQVVFSEDVNIVQVSAGSDFSCAVDDQGRLWAWGKNNYGQIGQGAEITDDQLTPVEVPFAEDTKIVSVATGKGHVLALDSNGNVYGWGLNASSQIGYYGYLYKETENAWERYILSPTLVLPADKQNPVLQVFANGNSSYILRADKKIYPWGQYGETDADGKTSYANLDLPEDKLDSITSVKDLSAGSLHLVAIKDDDTIFTWRWSFEGSLGGGESTVNAWMYNYPIVPEFSN